MSLGMMDEMHGRNQMQAVGSVGPGMRPVGMQPATNAGTQQRNPNVYYREEEGPKASGYHMAREMVLGSEYVRHVAAADERRATMLANHMQEKVDRVIQELEDQSAVYRDEFESLIQNGKAYMDPKHTIYIVPNGRTIIIAVSDHEYELAVSDVIMGVHSERMRSFFDENHIQPRIRARIVRSARVLTRAGRSEESHSTLFLQVKDSIGSALGSVHSASAFVIDFIKTVLQHIAQQVTIFWTVQPGSEMVSQYGHTAARIIGTSALTVLVTSSLDDWAGSTSADQALEELQGEDGRVFAEIDEESWVGWAKPAAELVEEKADAQAAKISEMQQENQATTKAHEAMHMGGKGLGMLWDWVDHYPEKIREWAEDGSNGPWWQRVLAEKTVGQLPYTAVYGFCGVVFSWVHYHMTVKDELGPNASFGNMLGASVPFSGRTFTRSMNDPKTADWMQYYKTQNTAGVLASLVTVPFMSDMTNAMSLLFGAFPNQVVTTVLLGSVGAGLLNPDLWNKLAEARANYEKMHGTPKEAEALEEYYREARAATATLVMHISASANAYYSELCANATGINLVELVPRQQHSFANVRDVHYVSNVCKSGIMGWLCRSDYSMQEAAGEYMAEKLRIDELVIAFNSLVSDEKVDIFGHENVQFVVHTILALIVHRIPGREADLQYLHEHVRPKYPCVWTYIWSDDWGASEHCKMDDVLHLGHIITNYVSQLSTWSNFWRPHPIDTKCQPLRDRSFEEGMNDSYLGSHCAASMYIFILHARLTKERAAKQHESTHTGSEPLNMTSFPSTSADSAGSTDSTTDHHKVSPPMRKAHMHRR